MIQGFMILAGTANPALVTDTVCVAQQGWPRLRVVSIAPLIAGALQRSLAGSSIGDPY